MKIWNKRTPIRTRLILWWHRLWLRDDEFHHSLDINVKIMEHMCDCEKERYSNDLAGRRFRAHNNPETPHD